MRRLLLRGWACAALSTLLGHAQTPPLREQDRLDLNSGTWAAVEPSEIASSVEELRQARQKLIEGQPNEACDILEDWLKSNDAHERKLEGVFLYGESFFDMKDYFAAYEQYEIVIEQGSGELDRKALTCEGDVARAFLSGEPRRILKTMPLPAYDDGIEILDKIWERAPGTRLGEEALRLKADYYFETGDADLAQQEYALLAQEYPNGRYRQLAMLRSAESAERAFPGVQFDDRPLLDADERYRQMEQRFPAYADRERVDARRKGIRDQRAAKDLDIADWYLKTERTAAGIYYLRALLRDWPDSFAAAEARSRLLALGASPDEPPGGPPTSSAPTTWPQPVNPPDESAPPDDENAAPTDAAPGSMTETPSIDPQRAEPSEPTLDQTPSDDAPQAPPPAPMDDATPMSPTGNAMPASPAAPPIGPSTAPSMQSTPVARPSTGTMGTMTPAQPVRPSVAAPPTQSPSAPRSQPQSMGSMSPATASPARLTPTTTTMQPRAMSPAPPPASARPMTAPQTPATGAAPTGTMRPVGPPRAGQPSTLPVRPPAAPPPKKVGTMKDVKG